MTEYLQRPFVEYVQNQPRRARDLFYGLREAKPDLVGFAPYDRLPELPEPAPGLVERCWAHREIENYLCVPEALLRWARGAAEGPQGTGPLFATRWQENMEAALHKVEEALRTLGKWPWSADVKASDEFLDPLFQNFFECLQLPNQMRKSDYHVLARHLKREEIDPEAVEVLDAILEVAQRARPVLSEAC